MRRKKGPLVLRLATAAELRVGREMIMKIAKE